ncbi:hypothetical protein QQS21_006029 [Conoideocrella luteorostrata]|uniref:Heterokaryon incompatibility domain-containing protein n=1 Tax=Conoideocrella luteorostrata TaxID=1105319 RepID=A0AAJ0CPA6_9HYPO|nr:hypothetical protein QQS21_006029 [Conoideocrella luteorostrata]
MSMPLEMALSLPPPTRYHFYYRDTTKYRFLQGEDGFHREFNPYTGVGKELEDVRSISTLKEFSGRPVTINVASRAGSHASTKIPRTLVAERGTQANFDQMRLWLRECRDAHSKCRIGIDRQGLQATPKLPSRVIDVGTLDSEEVRLFSNQLGITGKYATLSHRWKANGLVALTMASFSTLTTGFSMTSIPKTFQDAITVTRQLGLQYLWIDTFCIVQDDPQDWAIESARMGDIYEHAEINIAATYEADEDCGFLSSGTQGQETIRLPCADCGQDGCISFTNQSDSSFYQNVIQAHLNKRGWVFQERLLSRRTLHFASDQVYWECGQRIVSEDGLQHKNYDDSPETDPQPRNENTHLMLTLKHYNLDDTKIVLKKHFDFEHIGLSSSPSSSNQPSTPTGQDEDDPWTHKVVWMEVLRSYTKCQLSFRKDKLLALRGLASKMSTLMGGWQRYAAGHFITLESLLFTVQAPGGRPIPAPCSSWSCLSVEPTIDFYDCRGASPCVELCSYESSNPSREEDFTCLILKAPLKRVSRGPPNGEGEASKPRHFSMFYFSETQYGKFQKTLGPIVFDDADVTPKEFWIVPMFRVLPHRLVGNQVMAENCVVLALETSGKKRDGYEEFRRIGIGHVYLSGVFKDQTATEFALS